MDTLTPERIFFTSIKDRVFNQQYHEIFIILILPILLFI